MVAKLLTAEEWLAEVDSIINHHHERSWQLRGPLPPTRQNAIDRLVELGLSQGDAVRYLDRKRAKPAVSQK